MDKVFHREEIAFSRSPNIPGIKNFPTCDLRIEMKDIPEY